jgi:predicted peptidase
MPIRLQAFGSLPESVLPYRLMPPLAVNRGERYPLLVFLHGAGEKGTDNQTQLLGLPEQMAETRWRKPFSCFMVAPQCPMPLD